MNREHVREPVRAFLVNNYLGGNVDGLADDTQLLKLGILDSLRMVALMSFLEKEFGVAIDGDEVVATNFKTLNGIVEFVIRLQEKGGASS